MRRFNVFWRYQSKECRLYKWLLIVMLTSFSFACLYIRIYFKEIYAGLCAKDMLMFFSSDTIFLAFAGVISTISGLVFTYVDDNPNVVVRYNSKTKVYVYQSLSLLIIAVIEMFVVYVTAIISSYIILRVYDNWMVEGSLFNNMVIRRGLPVNIGLSDAAICTMFILRKAVLVWGINMVCLITEYITNWIRIAVFGAVMIYGVSLLSVKSISRYDLHILDLYNMPKAVTYTVVIVLIDILLVMVGIIISRRKQYYR